MCWRIELSYLGYLISLAFFPSLDTRGLVEFVGSSWILRLSSVWLYSLFKATGKEASHSSGPSLQFLLTWHWERAPGHFVGSHSAIFLLGCFFRSTTPGQGKDQQLTYSFQSSLKIVPEGKSGVCGIRSESETYIQGILSLLFRRIHPVEPFINYSVGTFAVQPDTAFWGSHW